MLNNQLDLANEPQIIRQSIGQNKEGNGNENEKDKEPKLNELRYQYQQAITDYSQLKRQIQTVSNETNCSFENALEQIGYTITWEKAGKKLEKIKHSLQTYYQEDVSVANST